MNVCRWCSGTEQLTDIFNPRLNNSEQLRFYFLLATGLAIREDDVVSKMVCHRCCEIAVKLHKYRANAVANDKLLKEQCGQAYVPPATDQDELRRLSAQILTSNGKILASPYGTTDGRLLIVDPKNTSESLDLDVHIKSEPVERVPEPYKHESVKKIYNTYPDIILPEIVYKCDIAPVVTLDENEVQEWAEEEFKRVQQKLSWAKIIIKKVGETSTSEKPIESTENIPNALSPQNNKISETVATYKPTENIVSTQNLLIQKKRPGPKSKTVDIVVNDKMPPLSIKPVAKRPGPKCKTIDLTTFEDYVLKSETIDQVNTVCDIPKQHDVVKYRPGPKSRKQDLAVNNVVVKAVIHESPSIKTVEKPKSVPKLQSKLDNLFNAIQKSKESRIEVDNPQTNSNTIKNGLIQSDDDDDFDVDSAILDTIDYDSTSSSDELETLSRNQKSNVNTKRQRTSQRLNKHSSIERDDNLVETPKLRTSQRLEKTDTKRDSRSLRSKKRLSSSESSKSGEFTESVKRRRTGPRNESENKVDTKVKIKVDNKPEMQQSNFQNSDEIKKHNKSDANTLKSEVSKGNSEGLTKSVNKEDSSKKDKNETVKPKSRRKARVSDKKRESLSSLSDKDTSSKSGSGDKKILVSTSTVQKAKDNPPSLLIGRTHKIYMCHTCCKLFDTNKELVEHQKSHLICQYCQYRMKNLETLKKHQKENCRLNIERLQQLEQTQPPQPETPQTQPLQQQSLQRQTQPQPTLKLTKVDNIESIVNQYPTAFDEDQNERTNKNATQTSAAVNSGNTQPTVSRSQTVSKSNAETNNSDIKTEILCISDESEDEVHCIDGSSIENALPKSFLDLPLSGMTESDMIRSLFTKHLNAGVKKLQRTTQTFVPKATDIKYTNSNLIVLENLFNELYTYKIPVQLEIRPKISARFIGPVVPPPKATIECWAHIEAITIRKPIPKLAVIAPKIPVRIAPAKLNQATSILPTSEHLSSDTSTASQFHSTSPITSTSHVGNVSQTNILAQPKFHTTTPILPSSLLVANGNLEIIESHSQASVLPTTQALVVTSSSSGSGTFQSSSLLPTPQTVIMSNSLPQNNTNTVILNNLLDSSPSVTSPSTLLSNTNLFLTSSNSFLSTINQQDKTPTVLSAAATNMTTTLIQTTNNGTLFMQNGMSPNATTIIQAPNNATLIQTPNAALIQTGNSNTFITPDNSNKLNSTVLPSTSTSPVLPQNSTVLMQTIPQINHPTIMNDQIVNSSNFVFQTPSQQIYQINNAGTNVNKVVVFSNTLSNGLAQNMPLYASPYLNDFPQSSVSIEEIEDSPEKNSNVNTTDTANQNTLRIKPSWELC